MTHRIKGIQLCLSVAVLCSVLQSGCVAWPYVVFGVSTPLRDVSNRTELWGGYERGAIYELLMDVFLADYKHYSFGPALAPGTEEIGKLGGEWGGPTTAEEYKANPARWPDVTGIVDAGTRLRCVKLCKKTYHSYVFADVERYREAQQADEAGRRLCRPQLIGKPLEARSVNRA